ncbi:MAG: bifunctional diguanylate cyclase/phosphodiesterase [bacterium]
MSTAPSEYPTAISDKSKLFNILEKYQNPSDLPKTLFEIKNLLGGKYCQLFTSEPDLLHQETKSNDNPKFLFLNDSLIPPSNEKLIELDQDLGSIGRNIIKSLPNDNNPSSACNPKFVKLDNDQRELLNLNNNLHNTDLKEALVIPLRCQNNNASGYLVVYGSEPFLSDEESITKYSHFSTMIADILDNSNTDTIKLITGSPIIAGSIMDLLAASLEYDNTDGKFKLSQLAESMLDVPADILNEINLENIVKIKQALIGIFPKDNQVNETTVRIETNQGVKFIRVKAIKVNNIVHALLEDVSELEKLKTTDPITGLPNEESLLMVLQNKMERINTSKKKLSVIRLGINNYNEILGFYMNTQEPNIRKLISDMINNFVNANFLPNTEELLSSDIYNLPIRVFALSNNQYGILVEEDIQNPSLSSLALEISVELKNMFKTVANSIYDVSIGYSDTLNTQNERHLIRSSLSAYEYAKRKKLKYPVRYSTFVEDITLRELGHRLFYIEHLNLHNFYLLIQPKIPLKSIKITQINSPKKIYLIESEIAGGETLSRLRNEDENISPNKFIKDAEDSGQLLQLTKHNISIVFNKLAEFKNFGLSCKFAINISCAQLKDGDADLIFAYLKEKVEEYKNKNNNAFPPVDLEITESQEITDEVIKNLKKLYDLGFSIAIDDFGTGNANINVFNKIPNNFDSIKIDKLFVDGIAQNVVNEEVKSKNIETLKTLFNLAKTHKKKIIIEGVETIDQLLKIIDLAKELDLTDMIEIQGYIFSKPIDFVEFKKLKASGIHKYIGVAG